MGVFVDISGYIFGRLTVVNFSHILKKHTYWNCKCICGNTKVIDGSVLKSGRSNSCGCYSKELTAKRSFIHGGTVGGHSVEYSAWLHMRERILNNKVYNYHNYGGRGIKICDRWLNSFENFFADMGKRPSKNHSLDRYPNINGDYEPSNCRWATPKEQAGNKRNNRWIEHNGENMILANWAIKLGVNYPALSYMVKTHKFEHVVNFYKNKKEKNEQIGKQK